MRPSIPGKLPLQLAVFDADRNKFTIDPTICISPVPAFGQAGGCTSDVRSFGTCCLSHNIVSNCKASSLSCVIQNCGACMASTVPCTGKSAHLAGVECAAWQDLYDATNGSKWAQCSDARSDPCSCRYESGGNDNDGHIIQM
jgi:hypothetical protein